MDKLKQELREEIYDILIDLGVPNPSDACSKIMEVVNPALDEAHL